MKTVFAVFGDPIEHSLSPIMHNSAFEKLGMDCVYHAFRVKREQLYDAGYHDWCCEYRGF